MKFGPFLGLDNLREANELAVFENGKPAGQYLRHAINVDLDNNGRVRRRRGFARAEAMADAHSLWSDGVRTLFCRDSGLYEITDFSPYAENLLTTLIADDAMSFGEFNGNVYFSNGTDSGRLMAGDPSPEPWSLPVPAAPVVSTSPGSLLAGAYLLAITFSNADGEEGGASPVQRLLLTVDSDIAVVVPSAPAGATHVNLYLSARDGEALTWHSTVSPGPGVATIDAPSAGNTLLQQHLAPQPAGQLVAIRYARLLVATGSLLTYSQPRTPGKYLPSKGFVQFADRITNIVPATGGVYLTTERWTYWLEGPDISTAAMRVLLPYGAAEGSRFRLPDETKVGWYGDAGVVLADGGGVAKAIQEDHLAADTAGSAAMLVQEGRGVTRLIAVLHGTVTGSDLAQPDIATERAGILHGL